MACNARHRTILQGIGGQHHILGACTFPLADGGKFEPTVHWHSGCVGRAAVRRGQTTHIAPAHGKCFPGRLEVRPHQNRRRLVACKMAANCGMGVTTFSKYCREFVDSIPMEFLNQCRLEQAARELRRCPYRAITEVAFEFGSNSSQYFATSFRKYYHISPKAFQNRYCRSETQLITHA